MSTMLTETKAKREIKKVNRKHQRAIDLLVCYPNMTMDQIAEDIGVTNVWLSTIMGSDAFKEAYDRRLKEHQAMMSSEIITKTQEVASKALDGLSKRLDEPGDVLSIEQVRETAEMALDRLGYTAGGGSNGSGPGQADGANVHIHIGASKETIEDARDRHQQAKTIEHQKDLNGPSEIETLTVQDVETQNDV